MHAGLGDLDRGTVRMLVTLYGVSNRQDDRDAPVVALSVKANLSFRFKSILLLQFSHQAFWFLNWDQWHC